MGGFKKPQLIASLVCLLVLASSIAQFPVVHAEASVEENQLLVFFRDVLRIDTSQCNMSVRFDRDSDNSPELGTRGRAGGKAILYFNSGGSVHAQFEFRGKHLTWCLVYYDTNNQNPIPYLEPQSGDHLELAQGFLERYEQFTGDSRISDMKDLLNSVTEVRAVSVVEGTLKLEITVREEEPDFDWSYTFEGEDYRLLGISFFNRPHIFTLGDRRYQYTMNSSVFPVYEPAAYSTVPTPSASSPLLNVSAASSVNIGLSVLVLAAAVSVGTVGFVCFRKIKRRDNRCFPETSFAGGSLSDGGKPVD
ncbi:MAG: hypothetical protein NWF00_00065 [Candidatus Bathyarchaeota archaeon]|nr:hypothetical protein [Candidatus Bathyarchaeota archaeon]